MRKRALLHTCDRFHGNRLFKVDTWNIDAQSVACSMIAGGTAPIRSQRRTVTSAMLRICGARGQNIPSWMMKRGAGQTLAPTPTVISGAAISSPSPARSAEIRQQRSTTRITRSRWQFAGYAGLATSQGIIKKLLCCRWPRSRLTTRNDRLAYRAHPTAHEAASYSECIGDLLISDSFSSEAHATDTLDALQELRSCCSGIAHQ